MVYNNIDCHVLNFVDMTSYFSLEKEKEKNRMIKILNTTIHHEMIAPLKAQMDISKCLFEKSISPLNKKMAKTIFVSSQMLLLHTQDLLDYRIIESGTFIPNMSLEPIHKVISEIVNMMNFTLSTQDLKIKYVSKKSNMKLFFDKRRVQQVLLNLLSNATKYQTSGVISVFSNISFELPQPLIQITVKDNGLGMDEEAVKRAFEPFSR